MRFRLSIWQRAVDFAYDQACWIAVVIAANHKITHHSNIVAQNYTIYKIYLCQKSGRFNFFADPLLNLWSLCVFGP